MTTRRVVITGIGAVTPIGNNVDEMWESVKAGKCGIAPITKFDTTEHKVTLGAEVKDFEFCDPREARRMDLFTQYGVTAADEAMAMSGLVPGENIDADRIITYVGSGIGGIRTIEDEVIKINEKGVRFTSAVFTPMIIGNIVSGSIAIKHGLHGTAMDVVTACACGTHCIGEAWRAIRHGYADAAVCGAAEAPFAPISFSGFANMKAMNTTDDPTRASIPFDKERGGFIMGEGAGVLVLEEYEQAKARGANIIGEVVGYGSTCDAYHITAPMETGEYAAKAIAMALESAEVKPEDISYINAHGTSTPLNDKMETKAVKQVFGEAAYKVPMSSTKAMMGHLLGAAGGVEAIVCIKSMLDGLIPPTINLNVPDEELDLDYVADGLREADVRYTMSSNFGFGGHNGSLVFKRFEE